jgi:hypothetical protein
LEHLTNSQVEQSLRYLSEIRDHMRLNAWEIVLKKDNPENEEAYADISPFDNYFCAGIRIAPDLFKEPPHVITEIFVHEMIHLYHRDLTDVWHDCVVNNDEVSEVEKQDWTALYTRGIERLVSQMASFLAPLAPQWPGSQKPAVRVHIEGE